MHSFIKKFLKPKEPKKFELAFDAIPAWLDEQENTSRSALEHETVTPIENIRNATAQLQHIVNGIADAEHDPAIHPKLVDIPLPCLFNICYSNSHLLNATYYISLHLIIMLVFLLFKSLKCLK